MPFCRNDAPSPSGCTVILFKLAVILAEQKSDDVSKLIRTWINSRLQFGVVLRDKSFPISCWDSTPVNRRWWRILVPSITTSNAGPMEDAIGRTKGDTTTPSPPGAKTSYGITRIVSAMGNAVVPSPRLWREFPWKKCAAFNIFTSSLVYHHSDGIRAFNKFRKNTAADTWSICFEEKPDMATLCCGKLVHIKCMRRWLRRTKSCHQCRGDMSRNPTIQLSPSFCSR